MRRSWNFPTQSRTPSSVVTSSRLAYMPVQSRAPFPPRTLHNSPIRNPLGDLNDLEHVWSVHATHQCVEELASLAFRRQISRDGPSHQLPSLLDTIFKESSHFHLQPRRQASQCCPNSRYDKNDEGDGQNQEEPRVHDNIWWKDLNVLHVAGGKESCSNVQIVRADE